MTTTTRFRTSQLADLKRTRGTAIVVLKGARRPFYAAAYEYALVLWSDGNWPRWLPINRYAHCGGEEAPEWALVPVGWTRRVWLHRQCWAAWREKRRAAP
jgi:hypothetical protein